MKLAIKKVSSSARLYDTKMKVKLQFRKIAPQTPNQNFSGLDPVFAVLAVDCLPSASMDPLSVIK